MSQSVSVTGCSPSTIQLLDPLPPATHNNEGYLSPAPRIKIWNPSCSRLQAPVDVYVSFSPSLPAEHAPSMTVNSTTNSMTEFSALSFRGVRGQAYWMSFHGKNQTISAKHLVRILACFEVLANSVTSTTDPTQCSCADGFDMRESRCIQQDKGIQVWSEAPLITYENDTAYSCFFNAVLLRAPSAPVSYKVVSSNVKEGVTSGSSITFTRLNWNITQSIWVKGEADGTNSDGDAAYSIKVGWPTTSDASFGLDAPLTLNVVNKNIIRPMIQHLSPALITSSGGEVNVTGSGFDRLSVFSLEQQSGNWTINMVYERPDFVRLWIGGEFKENTYMVVSVLGNGLGHSCPGSKAMVSLGLPTCGEENELYVTTGCPPGTYGNGIRCDPCPASSTCPGGSRVWPHKGYWSPAEGITPVDCFPPEACRGGRSSSCGENYDGDFCAFCKTDSYREGAVCEPCNVDGSDSRIFGLIVTVYIGVIIVSAIALPSAYLFTFTTALLSFQQLVQLGIAGSEFVPGMREVFSPLSLFLFDFNSVRPGCTLAPVKYPSFYFVTLFMLFASCIMMILCSVARTLILRFITHKSPQSPDYYFNYLRERGKENLTFVGYAFYTMTATRTFQLVNCQDVYQDNVMRIEMATTCYTGLHLIAAIIGWIILLVYIIGYPLYTVAFLRKHRESAENRSKFAAYKVTKFLLDDIKPQYYWYRGYVLLLSLSICVVSVYIYDVFDRLVVAFTLVCGKFLLVSYIWPMSTFRSNTTSMAITSVKMIQSIILAYMNNDSSGGSVGITVCCISIVVFGAALVIYYHCRLLKKSYSRHSLMDTEMINLD